MAEAKSEDDNHSVDDESELLQVKVESVDALVVELASVVEDKSVVDEEDDKKVELEVHVLGISELFVEVDESKDDTEEIEVSDAIYIN